MPERVEADVCVVGAGYAGLTTARRLAQHGKTVVVLEARDRVGGRIWTQQLSETLAVDRGGAWLSPKHDAMFGLVREMNASTYKTYVNGAHLLIDGDRTRRYTGLIPKISPAAILTIALAQWKLDRTAKSVPVDAPWTAKRVSEWDAHSVAWWFARSGVRSAIGRDLFEMAVQGLFPGDLNEVSFLNLLFLVRAHGSIGELFSIEGGSQENLVDGGAGTMANRMAADLGDAVRLSAPVRSITQHDDHVTVESDDLAISARNVVVTVPPVLALDINFDPVLPEDRVTLYRNYVAGPESKTLVVYDEPFWRNDGFSGQTSQPGSASELTIDASPSSGSVGTLASFTFGPTALRVDALDPAERRRAVIDALTARLGPRAASPVEYVETAWWEQEWSRGCSMAHFRPGMMTRDGHLLRTPFGRVHWAGTETATNFYGSMEGAVRSGERAAAEILDRG